MPRRPVGPLVLALVSSVVILYVLYTLRHAWLMFYVATVLAVMFDPIAARALSLDHPRRFCARQPADAALGRWTGLVDADARRIRAGDVLVAGLVPQHRRRPAPTPDHGARRRCSGYRRYRGAGHRLRRRGHRRHGDRGTYSGIDRRVQDSSSGWMSGDINAASLVADASRRRRREGPRH